MSRQPQTGQTGSPCVSGQRSRQKPLVISFLALGLNRLKRQCLCRRREQEVLRYHHPLRITRICSFYVLAITVVQARFSRRLIQLNPPVRE